MSTAKNGAAAATPDIPIVDLLEELGFPGESAAVARAELEKAGLTHPGKVNISTGKRDQAAQVLSRFTRACSRPACQETARRLPGELVTVPRQACPHCQGSDNRSAVDRMLVEMDRTGARRLLIVGGTPAIEKELLDLVAGRCRVEFVLVGKHRNDKSAAQEAKKADLVVLWASTPMPHKLSTLYEPFRPLVVHRRGIAALADEVAVHLRGLFR
jgi:hypothetical protein